MARRRNKATRRPARGAASRWPAFLAGCATGAAATLLIGSTDLPTLPLGGGAPGAAAGSGEGETPTPPNLRYDFYTILPEMEVALPLGSESEASKPPPRTVAPPEPVGTAPEVPAVAVLEPAPERPAPEDPLPAPVVEAAAPKAPEPPKTTVVSAAEAGGTYVLQVGSFRNAGDADRRRATLALLGLEARVQTIAIDGETTWHRVQVGPYAELGALNDVRVRLRENDIEAMALKVRAP